MTARRFITTLLLVVLTLSGATRALALPRDDDEKITPEEEQEARELVEEFNKKFVETNDIAPRIKDYFVPDFASRLNQHAETFPFQLIEWKDETAPPVPDDLQRFYVASTNCLHMSITLYAAAFEKAKKDRGEEGDEKDPKLEEVLPPAAVELIKSDPLLGKIWDEENNEDQESTQTPSDDAQSSSEKVAPAADSNDSTETEDQRENEQKDKIDDAEKLRRITSVLEGVSKILRDHLAAHPVTFEKREEGSGDESEEPNDELNFDPSKIEIFKNARVLSKEFYGYPKGTRLVCANAGLLHVEMVRVDGKLRILTVFLLMDD
jgi:hypothetical protein